MSIEDGRIVGGLAVETSDVAGAGAHRPELTIDKVGPTNGVFLGKLTCPAKFGQFWHLERNLGRFRWLFLAMLVIFQQNFVHF